jgi:hypothetical protein
MEIVATDSVQLLLTSPIGLRTGFDASDGDVVQDGGSYAVVTIEDQSGAGDTTQPTQFIDISQPTSGQYTLSVNGSQPGPFTATVVAFAQDGTQETPVDVSGSVIPGTPTTFNMSFSTTPGSSLSVTAVPRSLLTDLAAAIKAGLVKKLDGIVLTIAADAAIDVYNHHQCGLAGAVLDLLIAALQDMSGRGVDAATASVLIADANNLKAGCQK